MTLARCYAYHICISALIDSARSTCVCLLCSVHTCLYVWCCAPSYRYLNIWCFYFVQSLLRKLRNKKSASCILSLPRKMFQHWKASHIVSVLYTSITYKTSTAYASIDGCFQPYAIACCLSVVHWQFNLICSHPHSCPNIEWKGFNTWCCKLIPRRFPFSF